MKPEPWVEDMLRAKGVWNDDGVGRNARARRCKECGSVILAGLDGDRCAGIARVDLTPLTPVAEALAVSTLARTTYRLRWVADHYELDHRYAIAIAGTHADPGTVDVVPSHVCGVPVSTLALARPRERNAIDYSQPPPY